MIGLAITHVAVIEYVRYTMPPERGEAERSMLAVEQGASPRQRHTATWWCSTARGAVATDVLRLADAQNLAGKPVIDPTNPISDAPPSNGVDTPDADFAVAWSR